jgi:hypothetical protein
MELEALRWSLNDIPLLTRVNSDDDPELQCF